MKSITAIGSIALDSLVLPCGDFPEVLGGSASHFSTSCSHFNSRLAIVGVTGEDFPTRHLDFFKNKGVDTSDLVVQPGGKTFHWKGKYEKTNMDEAITLDTQLNVFENFSPAISEKNSNSEFLFLGNIHPALQLEVATSQNAGMKILDTMNLWIETTREILTKAFAAVDVVIINEGEAGLFTEQDHLPTAGKRILELGPDVVIIKKGANGAMLITKDDLFMVPSFPVKAVVDPTGAGDSFAGGFVGSLSEAEKVDRDALRRAVAYGNVMGSFNVEGVGNKVLSEISREQVEARYKEFQEMVRF